MAACELQPRRGAIDQADDADSADILTAYSRSTKALWFLEASAA